MFKVWSFLEIQKIHQILISPAKLSEQYLEWRFSRFPVYYNPEKLIHNADFQAPSTETDSGGLA